MDNQSVNMFVAFLAGLVSFLSPCVFPLVPVYIGYLSGPAVMGAVGGAAVGGSVSISANAARWKALAHSLVFVVGFTFVFVAVHGSLAGFISDAMWENRRTLERVMGVLLVVFGLHMLGMIRIPFLDYTRRLDIRPANNLGYLRSFLIGIGFAIGWTPCVGPTLTLMYGIASTNPDAAFPLFLAYSLGLGIPFLIAGLAMGQISAGMKKLTRRSFSLKLGRWAILDQVNAVSLVSGLLLMIMGVLVFTGSLTLLNQWQFVAPFDL